MSCNNNNTTGCKCHKTPCGCEDTGLTTPPPCNIDTPECPNPDPCPETFSDECLVHTTDTIFDLNIQQGDRYDDILQKIVLMFTNPDCILPGGSCLSVVGLQSTTITTTTIAVKWSASATATQYIVEYKPALSLSWTLNPATTNTTDTIGGLIPNSDYHIRVSAICSSGSCYSVTIVVTTKTT